MVYTAHGPKQSGRRGQYVGHHWFDDVLVLPDELREMPFAVPTDLVVTHDELCECGTCAEKLEPDALRDLLARQILRLDSNS